MKVFLLLVFVIYSSICNAQIMEIVQSDLTAKELFSNAREILATVYSDCKKELDDDLGYNIVAYGRYNNIHSAFGQIAIRTLEGILPASYTVQVHNDPIRPIGVYRIIHFDVPVPIFWYVELLNNHITSDQITGIPLPIQVAKNSSNALQGSPSISSR